MQKLKLQLDSLQVESFEASAAVASGEGTVRANMATPACTGVCSYDPLMTCDYTCAQVPSCRIMC